MNISNTESPVTYNISKDMWLQGKEYESNIFLYRFLSQSLLR
jgi:hypothetical protein